MLMCQLANKIIKKTRTFCRFAPWHTGIFSHYHIIYADRYHKCFASDVHGAC